MKRLSKDLSFLFCLLVTSAKAVVGRTVMCVCWQAAEEMGSLQQRQRDSSAYQAAVAARAATGAAAANLRKRCNQCEACLTSQVTLYSCSS